MLRHLQAGRLSGRVDFLRPRLSSGIPSVKPYRLAFIVIAVLAAAGAFTLFRPTDTWMGLRGEEQAVNAGTYKTLDDCKRHVERTGGWCGHNCKDYGSGLVADCKPLVQVPKK
jgi:hypothetical protein